MRAERQTEDETGITRSLLLTSVLSVALAPLSTTLIIVGLPAIRHDFGISFQQVAWLAVVHVVAMILGQPLGGTLGDRFGRLKLLRLVVAALAALSIAAGLASDFRSLLFIRAGQGCLAALLVPNAMALVRANGGAKLGTYLGIVGAASGITAAVGPLLGSLLLLLAGWRALFVAGAALAGGILIAASRASEMRPVEPNAHRAGGASSLQSRPFFTALGIGSGVTGLLHAVLILIPFTFTASGTSGSIEAGLVLGVMALAAVVCAPLSGRLADRVGRRMPVLLGASLLLGGLLGLAVLPTYGSLAMTFLPLLIFGAGVGVTQTVAMTTALEAAPARLAGLSAGLTSAGRYIGQLVGTSLVAVLLPAASGEVSGLVFREAFLLGLAGAAAIAAASSILPGTRPSESSEPSLKRDGVRNQVEA